MSQIKPRGELRQREKPYRSEAYRRHVASQPCKACGWHKSQAAHISAGNYARGMKAPDYYCIPLCRQCHDHFDGRSGRYLTQEQFALSRLGVSIDELKAEAQKAWEEWNK